MKFLVVFSFCVVTVCGRYTNNAENNVLNKCADGFQEFTDCLKYKTIKVLDRVLTNKQPIPLVSFLYLTHEGHPNETQTNFSEHEEEEAISSDNANDKLNDVLYRRVKMLTTSKSLQVKLDATVEGRRKNTDRPLMMILGAGAVLLHHVLSKIAFIAGKALIIAKIALVLSAVIGLKKLLTPEHHDSTQVIYKQAETGHTAAGWHRSIENQDQAHAHQLAYSAHVH